VGLGYDKNAIDTTDPSVPQYDKGAMLLTRSEKGDAFARQALSTSRPSRGQQDDSKIDVLDVGCGYGFTSAALAKYCNYVHGIEPSLALATYAVEAHRGHANLSIEHADLLTWRTDRKFDLIILDNVYEHIPAQEEALDRIADLLKPGGAFYIVVPNKLWPIEPHYGLPFLSYLPLPLANKYLRLTRRGEDYTDASYAPTYWSLKRQLEKQGRLRYAFVLPADLSLTETGNAVLYRLGVAAIRAYPGLWSISKALLVVGTLKP